MNAILFYDTETTGLPLFNEPSEDPRQPHIVQIAAVLFDVEARLALASIDLTVRPDGWVIPEEVSRIHGITTEHAADVGVREQVAIDAFMDMWAHRLRVAHNEQFDARILRIALRRFARDRCEGWEAGKAECTATLATPIMRLPPTARMVAAGRHHHKTPNLTEAFEAFTGQKMRDAHTAMGDVQACLQVWQTIRTAKVAA